MKVALQSHVPLFPRKVTKSTDITYSPHGIVHASRTFEFDEELYESQRPLKEFVWKQSKQEVEQTMQRFLGNERLPAENPILPVSRHSRHTSKLSCLTQSLFGSQRKLFQEAYRIQRLPRSSTDPPLALDLYLTRCCGPEAAFSRSGTQ
jgi:hypothetical protein